MPSRYHNQHDGGSPPPPKPNQKLISMFLKLIIMTSITTLFFLFLGIAAIILLLATAALHRRHTTNHHQRHQDQESSNSSNGLSSKELKKLPQFKYSRKIKPESEGIDCCVVCLDGFRQGQWCRKLAGCGHVFHRKCVDNWLVKVSVCPICRSRVCDDSVLEDSPLWGFRHIVGSR
ncbi:RING-H2 finger protein ATL56-like [Mercurialis annua]|uniref:RING-H2 finger protein ATL56-like n=1 Tax=Mercurialis annua TaxID=3986 RepID=UPI00215E0B2B|nr:RING-H2 finger protein ATL56-like [Mercurialis annua]